MLDTKAFQGSIKPFRYDTIDYVLVLRECAPHIGTQPVSLRLLSYSICPIVDVRFRAWLCRGWRIVSSGTGAWGWESGVAPSFVGINVRIQHSANAKYLLGCLPRSSNQIRMEDDDNTSQCQFHYWYKLGCRLARRLLFIWMLLRNVALPVEPVLSGICLRENERRIKVRVEVLL
jgi:hypothetical protein